MEKIELTENKCHPDCPGDTTCRWTKVCMCGAPIGEVCFCVDHLPVSMHDYMLGFPYDTYLISTDE